MEQTALTYLCPDCMAYLRYDGKEQKWVCDYCGGEIVTDDVTAATFCVFCGNPTILPTQLEGEYRHQLACRPLPLYGFPPDWYN